MYRAAVRLALDCRSNSKDIGAYDVVGQMPGSGSEGKEKDTSIHIRICDEPIAFR